MEQTVEQREPANRLVASPKPSKPWVLEPAPSVLGPVHDEHDSRVKPLPRPYSFLAECECPHDCPRDHDNE